MNGRHMEMSGTDRGRHGDGSSVWCFVGQKNRPHVWDMFEKRSKIKGLDRFLNKAYNSLFTVELLELHEK